MSVEKRWKKHCSAAFLNNDNNHFHNAIRKYKPENFVVKELVCIADNNLLILKKYLGFVEQIVIKCFNTYPNEYNSTPGGEGVKDQYGERNSFYGKTHTQETRRKIGDKSIERQSWKYCNTKEVKKKMVKTKIKNGTKWFSDYARERARETNTGRRYSNEEIQKRIQTVREKRSINHLYGKTDWTDELRSKTCKSHNGKIIIQYDMDGNQLKKWDGFWEIKRDLGYDPSAICKCCRGKIKSSHGSVWKYAS